MLIPLLTVTSCHKMPWGNDPVRIGCLPVLRSTPWHDIAWTDQIQSHLSGLQSKDYYFIPYQWVNESIFMDSISYPEYLVHFTKRCDYDMLILAYTDSIGPDYLRVNADAYDFRTVRSAIPHATGEVHFSSMDSIIQGTIQILFEEAGIPFVSVPHRSFLGNPALYRGRNDQFRADHESAIEALDRAFKNDTTDADIRLALCQSLVAHCIETENPSAPYNPAFIRTKNLLSALPDSGGHACQIHKLLALMDVYLEQWNSAENHLRAIWPDDEREDPDLLFILSRLNSARQKTFGYPNQKEILKRIIQFNPAHQKAWLNLAQYYFYQNRMEQAERTYQEMIRIHTHCLSAWLGLGKVYLVQNRFADMTALYERVIERWRDSSEVIYNLGLAYHYQGDTENAIRFFNRAIQIDNHAYSHYFLGIIDLKENRTQEALDHFRQCVAAHPKKDDPYVVMARKEIQKRVDPANADNP